MNSAQQLKLILQLSGLTQEKLARKLDISFVTLNSWLHAKSTPRKKAQETIEELYREYTGQKIILPDILTGKKQHINNKE